MDHVRIQTVTLMETGADRMQECHWFAAYQTPVRQRGMSVVRQAMDVEGRSIVEHAVVVMSVQGSIPVLRLFVLVMKDALIRIVR